MKCLGKQEQKQKLPELYVLMWENGPVYLMEKTNSKIFLVRSQNTFLIH